MPKYQESLLRGHTAKIWSVGFASNSDKIVSSADDGTARLWNLEGQEIMKFKGHTSQLLSANFSPDGKYVVTGSGDGTARIWNIEPKENPVFRGHSAWVVDANFSLDGSLITTAGLDHTARLWAKNGEIQKVLQHPNYYCVDQAIFSNGNTILTTNYTSGEIRLYNQIGDLVKVIKQVNGIERGFKTAFSTDGMKIISKNFKDQVIIWDTSGHKLTELNKTIDAFFFPHSGNMIGSISKDSSIYFWREHIKEKDTLYYDQLKRIKIPGRYFTSIQISNDEVHLIASSDDSCLFVWRVSEILQGKELDIKPFIKENQIAGISFVRCSDSGKYFLFSLTNNLIIVWRKIDEKFQYYLTLKGHSDAINDAEFSHDEKNIITASNDNTVRVWDFDGNNVMTLTNHTSAVYKAKFSPDCKYILSASFDHTARLTPWRVEDVLQKINVDKVRGEVWKLGEKDKEVYGIQ